MNCTDITVMNNSPIQTSPRRFSGAIEYKISELNDTENSAKASNDACIDCPICEQVVQNENSIECHKCNSWIHKRCTSLTDEQFNQQVDHKELDYTCNLCETLDVGEQQDNSDICEFYNGDRDDVMDISDTINNDSTENQHENNITRQLSIMENIHPFSHQVA